VSSSFSNELFAGQLLHQLFEFQLQQQRGHIGSIDAAARRDRINIRGGIGLHARKHLLLPLRQRDTRSSRLVGCVRRARWGQAQLLKDVLHRCHEPRPLLKQMVRALGRGRRNLARHREDFAALLEGESPQR